MNEITLLKYLKNSRGSSIYDIIKEFKLSRTAVIYHLNNLLKSNLITSYKQSRKIVYIANTGDTINDYFNSQIKSLQDNLKEINNLDIVKRRSRGQKLNLVIPNYFDLTLNSKNILKKYYNLVDYSDTQLYLTQDEFVNRTRDADVILNNWACDITADVLDKLPNLQYMHLSTHMYRYVDIGACKKHSVRVSNIPYSYKSIAISEFLISQTFALLRQTIPASTQVQSGVSDFRFFKGSQLRGKKAIIFGVDDGTKDLVQSLKSLGVEVSIYTEDKNENPAIYGLSRFASKFEVFNSADLFYVSWTGDENKALIGKLNHNFLDQIVNPVYIISVFKHKEIDFDCIRELIYLGKIKGIAFDYFPDVSIGDSRASEVSKILYLPNVIITPDIAWYTQDSVINMNKTSVDRLVAYAKGDDSYLLI